MTLACVKLTKPKPTLEDGHSEGVQDRGAPSGEGGSGEGLRI